MTQKVVITGANRGIGLALTQEYLRRGDDVIALCRNASASLEKSGAHIITGIDISEPHTLVGLKEHFLPASIDLLINNAGIHCYQQLGSIDYEELEEQFRVNAVGPLRLTELLLDCFAPQAKVALVTSRMGSITDNGSGGSYAYRMAKCALNAAGKSLAIDLKPRGIAVALLHPGFVQTEMVNFNGDVSPEVSAQGLSQRIDLLTIQNTGSFWHANGQELPW